MVFFVVLLVAVVILVTTSRDAKKREKRKERERDPWANVPTVEPRGSGSSRFSSESLAERRAGK